MEHDPEFLSRHGQSSINSVKLKDWLEILITTDGACLEDCDHRLLNGLFKKKVVQIAEPAISFGK